MTPGNRRGTGAPSASTDWGLRGEAAVDLVRWNDPRAFEALRHAADDQEFAVCAADEIGRSLAVFVERGVVGDPRADDLHPAVRYVMDAASAPKPVL